MTNILKVIMDIYLREEINVFMKVYYSLSKLDHMNDSLIDRGCGLFQKRL